MTSPEPTAPPLPAPSSGNGPAPLPAPGSPPAPAPPAAPAPPPAAPAPAGDGQGDAAELRAALAAARRDREAVQKELDKLRAQGMTDQERAVADAKESGRKEASVAAGIRVAAAEFRALAAGKLADPGKMLEDGDLNLARFVTDDGEVDKRGLARLVDRLAAAAAPAPNPGTVPAGPRGAPPEQDFLRAALGGHPRIGGG
jgi:hypothetical protein